MSYEVWKVIVLKIWTNNNQNKVKEKKNSFRKEKKYHLAQFAAQSLKKYLRSVKKSFVLMWAAVCYIRPDLHLRLFIGLPPKTCAWLWHLSKSQACYLSERVIVLFSWPVTAYQCGKWWQQPQKHYFKWDREREWETRGEASNRFHGPKMMNQFSNVCWQFLMTADWAGSFWKASAITANTPLDAHKKSWQHLSVCWHSGELKAPHLLPLMSNTKEALIHTVC